MPRKKMKFPSVRKQLERRKKIKEVKLKARAPRPLIKDDDGDEMPLGWGNMSRLDKRVDNKRRLRQLHFSKPKNPSGTVRVTYTFMPSELGFMGPTQEEIALMEDTDPRTAKRMRNYKELSHKIVYPHAFMRDDSLSMKKQMKEERERVKQLLLSSAKQEQMLTYDPEGPTLDLDNLTTAGDSE